MIESEDRIQLPENSLKRKLIENLWSIYGNAGKYSTLANHKFIQELLVDQIDYRNFYNPQTKCLNAVDVILAAKTKQCKVAMSTNKINVAGRIIQLPESFKGNFVITAYQENPCKIIGVYHPDIFLPIRGWVDIDLT